MNGELEGEKRDSVVASASDPLIDRESDGGDDLSQYSSCGGESEMDRYYSAGSAMGTPRVVSSSFHNSDFSRIFNLGGESGVYVDEKPCSSHLEMSGGLSSPNCVKDFFGNRNGGEMLNLRGKLEVSIDVARNIDVDDKLCNGVSTGDGNTDMRDGKVSYEDIEEVLDDGEDLKNSGYKEGEPSLSNEHSEGEDSMFGCGSDDEGKIQYYHRKSVFSHEQDNWKTGDPMVMSSAAAFGSDDWDDFFHENKEGSGVAMGWSESDVNKQRNQEKGIGFLGFTPELGAYSHVFTQQYDVKNTSISSDKAKEDAELAEKDVETDVSKSLNNVFTSERTACSSGPPLTVNDDLEQSCECSAYSSEYEMNQSSLKRPLGLEEFVYAEAESDIKVKTAVSDVMNISPDFGSYALKGACLESYPLLQQHQDDQNYYLEKIKVGVENESREDDTSFSEASQLITNKNVSLDQIEDHFVPTKTKDMEFNDLYCEIVNDMQDVLLDSSESPRSGVTHGSRMYQSQMFHPSRDGGSTSSTSGTDYAYDWIQHVPKIDRVEVVGASQKKGDVSFSERLVGVQKHAVYNIRVWSGEDHWEVERRYRDFSALYHRLKKLFSDNGWTLPSPWAAVEGESLKFFGSTSPSTVADRSVLIQECLQSIISSNISINLVTCFLTPLENAESDSRLSWPSFPNRGKLMENAPTFGKTISLVVHIQPSKSVKEMLELQYYRCAGCHKYFDDGTSKARGLVMALGWGKPRYCEYIGQLFCSSCHANDTAVIPSKVLHYWDFTLYPVSLLAKSFLDSINEQPMLCVGAINPFLFSKVPTLQHVANIRNRIRAMLPYVRCPFRKSINRSLGTRSYLLDTNDFFALKDLIDLSKGVFSVLAVMVDSLSHKIEDHITEQCLICYDVGVPCGARHDCINPLALIFPFQEGDVEKCKRCEVIFHKKCFQKVASCSCGASGGVKLAEPSSGIVTGLFSKVLPSGSQLLGKQKKPATNSAAILMASLPNTSL